jgi:hypothetical protein
MPETGEATPAERGRWRGRDVRFLILDRSAPDSAEAKFLERLAGIIPHGIEHFQKYCSHMAREE